MPNSKFNVLSPASKKVDSSPKKIKVRGPVKVKTPYSILLENSKKVKEEKEKRDKKKEDLEKNKLSTDLEKLKV